jgi:glycogen(starch) synthase
MPKKMRILFISMEYPPETGWGGIGSYLSINAPALAARGHEVHVLSCVRYQKHKDYFDQGVYIHRRSQVKIFGLGTIKKVLRIPQTIERFLIGISNFLEYRRLGIDFDVIEYPDWNAEGWFFVLLHKKPIVASLHTPLPLIIRHNSYVMNFDRKLASYMERYAVHGSEHITSPSDSLIKALLKIGWLKGRDVEIIPIPIDWQYWSKTRPVEETPPIVLYVGRLEPLKAPELLVESIKIIREELPEAKVLFIGNSNGQRDGLSYLEWLKKLADGKGCFFMGHVPRKELLEYYSKCRILAMPSVFESYGIVAIEAMSAGRPVVVTETTGAAEIIKEVGGGIILSQRNSKALAEAIKPFLIDADYAAIVGEKARVSVREHLDPGKIAIQREMVYLNAIRMFNK